MNFDPYCDPFAWPLRPSVAGVVLFPELVQGFLEAMKARRYVEVGITGPLVLALGFLAVVASLIWLPLRAGFWLLGRAITAINGGA